MKQIVVVAILLFGLLGVRAQVAKSTVPSERGEATIRKQIAVDSIENQLKDVPFAAIRVYVGCSVAKWLWQAGEDGTGRAEPVALAAFEELEKKKDEGGK